MLNCIVSPSSKLTSYFDLYLGDMAKSGFFGKIVWLHFGPII